MTFNINKTSPRNAARALLSLGTFLAVTGSSAVALATPRPLPFTYPVDTLAEGEAEVEIYADTTPLRVQADPADASKGRLWENYYHLQSEFEFGLADRWELGVYQVFEANPQPGGGNVFSFDGFMARIRTRLTDPGEWPVDVGLYLEAAYFHDEVELEEKILLQRRFGRMRAMANLWVEQEWDRAFDDAPNRGDMEIWINPTIGATYELSARLQVGGEYWVRGRLGSADEDADPATQRNAQLHHFLGPTLYYSLGRVWLSTGLYAHLNDANKPQPGEAYGPFWLRSVIGIDL